MPFGADARGRLAVLPAFVLVIPFRCSMVAPMRGTLVVPPAASPKREEPRRIAVAPRREPEPIGPSAASPKREDPAPRVPSVPPPAPVAPPQRAVTFSDEVVVKALGTGQPAFLRCWARAQRSDDPPSASKVRLHLEVDDHGKVTSARSDTDSPALERCLSVVARGLAFPAPGQPAVVDLPLMFDR